MNRDQLRRQTIIVVAMLAAAECLYYDVCRRAYAQDVQPVVAQLIGNKNIGVAFGELDEAANCLDITLHVDLPQLITYSHWVDPSGDHTWNPTQITQPSTDHEYEVEGVIPNEGHAVRFEGTLGSQEQGPGGSATPFKASVADIDIDIDSLGTHSDGPTGHWPPSNDNDPLEDEVESGPNGGLVLPPELILKGTPPDPEFPSSINPNTAPYKAMKLRARLRWTGGLTHDPGTPALLGYITLDLSGGGFAVYAISAGTMSPGTNVSAPIPVYGTGVSEEVISWDFGILTNEDFTGSGTITATFAWLDQGGLDEFVASGTDTAASDDVAVKPSEWKAWPGGQTDPALNPTETFTSADFGFTGNVDWNVGRGATHAVIVGGTTSTTATNCASITVRYDTRSATAEKGDTVHIEAIKDGKTVMKMRTVFKATWNLLNFNAQLAANTLSFDKNLGYGNTTNVCGFNWPPDDGAWRVAGKMEARLKFEPTGIDWQKRGVDFRYASEHVNAKSTFRLQRKRIRTWVSQPTNERDIASGWNDAGWVYDGESDSSTTQYPTTAGSNAPDWAFRTDAPGFNPTTVLSSAMRGDLRELAEWHNGTDWICITPSTGAEWHFNGTSVLPNGNKGGTNNHGPSVPAESIPNKQPGAVASATPANPVNVNVEVTLHGETSTDDDHDALTYKWTQDPADQQQVTLDDDTSKTPKFTPTVPATLHFSLKVSDITKNLNQHKPNPENYESSAATVTVIVQ